MIQPKEIRLGNLFLDRENRLCEVEQISVTSEDTKIRSINYAITSMPIRPIPLTEICLTNFGFENASGSYFHNKLPSLYFKKPYGGADYYLVKTISLDKLTSIKTVHQLQNLYFALTGEELNREQFSNIHISTTGQ